MKQKDLKKLSKKALIKRLQRTQSENWTLITHVLQKDGEIAELTAQSLMVDEIFSQTVRQNLEKLAVLEAKLARYQEVFGFFDDEHISNDLRERGRDERCTKLINHNN